MCFGIFFFVNIGSIDDLVEIVVFVLGLDFVQIDVLIDKGLLIISGECKCFDFQFIEEMCVYVDECFMGVFCCVIELL